MDLGGPLDPASSQINRNAVSEHSSPEHLQLQSAQAKLMREAMRCQLVKGEDLCVAFVGALFGA